MLMTVGPLISFTVTVEGRELSATAHETVDLSHKLSDQLHEPETYTPATRGRPDHSHRSFTSIVSFEESPSRSFTSM